jgi:hypothetical protein
MACLGNLLFFGLDLIRLTCTTYHMADQALLFNLRWMITIIIAISITYPHLKWRMELKRVVKVQSNGCPRRWGWCKKWPTRIAQKLIICQWNLCSSFTISNIRITRSTPPATATAILESARIVTLPQPHFGGAVRAALRFYLFTHELFNALICT